jgi:acetyl-CoA C-acetyltransferase
MPNPPKLTDAVICAAARTPIGAFQGGLAPLSAPELGAIAIQAALERAGLAKEKVERVIMGNVLSGGIGQAPARQAAIKAGLPVSAGAITVNKVCGSGLQAVMFARRDIAVGDIEIAIAGGMESMTNAPYLLPKARGGYRLGNGEIIDSVIHDGLWDPYGKMHMGVCGDRVAEKYGFTREQQDAFAAESYKRARAAAGAGKFKDEIVPVSIAQRKGEPTIIDQDEEPGRGDPARFASLRPAFSEKGTVTAANASSLNDGAAALVIASEAAADALKLPKRRASSRTRRRRSSPSGSRSRRCTRSRSSTRRRAPRRRTGTCTRSTKHSPVSPSRRSTSTSSIPRT